MVLWIATLYMRTNANIVLYIKNEYVKLTVNNDTLCGNTCMININSSVNSNIGFAVITLDDGQIIEVNDLRDLRHRQMDY